MSVTRYGYDVAAVRADDLDKLMLEYVSKQKDLRVLDLGCGSGGQSFRLAAAGASVLGIDVADYSENFSNHCLENNILEKRLSFIQGDIRILSEMVKDQKFDVACVQRTIHYLTHNEAKDFLLSLKEYVTDKLYISVSGLESDIGKGYQDREEVVEKRFAELKKINADKFFIHEPVCLYTSKEFEDLLMETGWKVERIWQSAFGNIKAICTHK